MINCSLIVKNKDSKIRMILSERAKDPFFGECRFSSPFEEKGQDHWLIIDEFAKMHE